jgi:hypothetical protein
MTINEIKIRLDKTISILNDSKILERDSYKMIMTDNSEEFTIVDDNEFLKNVRISLWKLSIIELHKLYAENSNNNHYRIVSLLEEISRQRKKSEWCDCITKSEINKMFLDIQSPETTKNIENLKDIRNQHYAHTDKKPKKNIHDIKYYHDSSNYLIQLADNILEQLMIKLIDKNFKILKYEGENATNFLEQQSEYIRVLGIHKLNKLL